MNLQDRFSEASQSIETKHCKKRVKVKASNKRENNKKAVDSYFKSLTSIKRDDPTLEGASAYSSNLISHYNTVANAISRMDQLTKDNKTNTAVYRSTRHSLSEAENQFDLEKVLPEATIIQASPTIDGNQRFIIAQIKASNLYGKLANAQVVIPTSEFGFTINNINLAMNIGQSLRVGILGFIDMSKIDPSRDGFILLGSVAIAEWIIEDHLFYRTTSWLLENKYIGIKDIGKAVVRFRNVKQAKDDTVPITIDKKYVDNNTYTAEILNYSQLNSSIYIKYKGIRLNIYKNNFTHSVRTEEINKIVSNKTHVNFTLTSVRRRKAQNLNKVMDSYVYELLGKKTIVPEYEYSLILNSKIYEDDPTTTVKKMYDSKATYIANVVNVDPIYGVFVEVAPSIIYKARDITNLRPTYRDSRAYTRCVIKIDSIDDKDPRHGKATILSYPDGLA